IAQDFDIGGLASAVTQLVQYLELLKDVFFGKCQRTGIVFTSTQAAVDLHAANAGQVVSFFAVEQALEQGLDGVFRGRLARAHHAVDGDTSGVLVGGLVGAQRSGDVATAVQVVDVQRLDLADKMGRAS